MSYSNQIKARAVSFKLKPQFARDSYKLLHDDQYPVNTELVYSNFTPRSAKHFKVPSICGFDNKVTWVGLQGTLMDYNALWHEQFFSRPWEEVEVEYVNRTSPFIGRAPDVARLKALHDIGYLPLHVKQIPEGNLLNIGIPAFTVANTHPGFSWLTNATETYLSNESWKISTVATIATAYRKVFDKYAELTGGPTEFVDWQGHCFADRGQSGFHDAAKNCSGHGVAFLGSDSVASSDWTSWAYFADGSFVAGSVPATEHAVTGFNIFTIEDELSNGGNYEGMTLEEWGKKFGQS